MKRIISLIACVLLACIAGRATAAWKPLAWDIYYGGNVLPDANDVIRYSDLSTPGKFTGTTPVNLITNVTDGSVYRMSTLATDKPAYWSKNFGSVPATLQPDSNKGYTVEIRARINDIDGTAATNAITLFSVEEATTGVTRYWSLNFQKDTVTGIINVGIATTTTALYKPLGSVSESSGWHTYRITADNSGVKLYVDGYVTAADSLAAYGTTSTNSIRFGDPSNAQDADLEVDYIGIYSSGAVVVCNTTLLGGDVNQDCEVGTADIDDLSGNWLESQQWNYKWDADQYPNSYKPLNLKIAAFTAITPVQPFTSLGGGNNAYRITLTTPTAIAYCQTRDTIDVTENGTWNPSANGNNTIEFRMRIVSDEGNRGTVDLNYYAFAAITTDWDINPGFWESRGFYFNYDSIVEQSDSSCSNCANYVLFDCSQWNTYRIDYNAGTATLTYWNGNAWQTLLTSSTGRSFTGTRSNSMGNFFRLGKSDPWGGYGVTEVDYASWKGIGGRRILGDVSTDNNVDLNDFAKVANDWLLSN